jgi:hypothetical protein
MDTVPTVRDGNTTYNGPVVGLVVNVTGRIEGAVSIACHRYSPILPESSILSISRFQSCNRCEPLLFGLSHRRFCGFLPLLFLFRHHGGLNVFPDGLRDPHREEDRDAHEPRISRTSVATCTHRNTPPTAHPSMSWRGEYDNVSDVLHRDNLALNDEMIAVRAL